ncbi:hypothetical protein MEBOL_000898 [Melittangium boletus DSM 14713]|uniref:Uncharacterized protein n=1 Tax=Melittangium boletus DSM 14713 TaxID=1294270 RepID=A0A250I912_9BACT|nr:hypothetical protein MEBOL_000898 [Melittangium boletus DSM 14713]
MKWREALVVLLGVLLPLPLLLAMGILPIKLFLNSSERTFTKVVPMIPPGELRGLPSFLQHCDSQSDCDPPLACLKGQPMRPRMCTVSTCMTDLDCGEGFACRSIQAGERILRVCGVVGTAREGEWCLAMPFRQESACAPGLVCANRRCGRRCEPQNSPSCPSGFTCRSLDAEGPVCFSSCEGLSCPDGQRCVQEGNGISQCLRVSGQDCQNDEPCVAPQVCEISAVKASRRHVRMWCALPCESLAHSCPEGFDCVAKRCRRRCSPDKPGSCASFEKCWSDGDTTSGFCLIDT